METGLIIVIIGVSIVLVGFAVFFIMWMIARSKGKITLTLDKYEFSPGETAKGKLKLDLKKPLHAEALNIEILAKIKSTQLRQGRASSSSRTISIFKKPIAGPGDYPIGENSYDFDITIPTNLGNPEGIMNTAVKGMQALMGSMRNTRYYLKASLEIPGMNVSSKKIQINII